MHARILRMVTVAMLIATSTVALTAVAGATPNTYTKITTPSGPTKTIQLKGPPSTTTLTVSGQTSSGVTTVDIVCVIMSMSGPSPSLLKDDVPVIGNAFSTVVSITNLVANCRLRAIPNGVDPEQDYIGSYTGPILYMWGVIPIKDGSTTVGYQALNGRGDGIAVAADAASCGPMLLATVTPPRMEVRSQGNQACQASLPRGNFTNSVSSTTSTIRVGGHNAYLPAVISSYLRKPIAQGGLELTLPQPALTTSFVHASNGDLTITESTPLRRCSVNDAYPPTSVSCPSLTGTGVTFKRITSLIRGSHQIRVRDSFTSTDGQAHSVYLQYQGAAQAAASGRPGFMFPGTSHFVTSAHDQVVTGLGTKAATLFIRSDIRAFEGEQFADTWGLTWSRAPRSIRFAHDTGNNFATPYASSVPRNGSVYLGFAVSQANLTADAKPLAASALREMMNVPSIISPANNAQLTGHSITVRGAVTRGANGLPTSVSVSGHAAVLTVISSAKATYKVTFSLPYGPHTITARATDNANNVRTKSINLRNSP